MKLELTWPSGFKSAIWSGRGRVAGALPLPAAKLAAQFGAGRSAETPDVLKTAPDSVEDSAPGGNAKRCSTGWNGAPVRSKPPSEPTPLPRPISSIAGMTARGTMDGAVGSIDGAFDKEAVAAFVFCDAPEAAAAAAKLAIGRTVIRAWRMESRVKSWTNCERRKRTSILAGCTLTSTSS